MAATPRTRSTKTSTTSSTSSDMDVVKATILWLRKNGIAAAHVRNGGAEVTFTDHTVGRGGGVTTPPPREPTANEVQAEYGGAAYEALKKLEERMTPDGEGAGDGEDDGED